MAIVQEIGLQGPVYVDVEGADEFLVKVNSKKEAVWVHHHPFCPVFQQGGIDQVIYNIKPLTRGCDAPRVEKF